MVIYQDQDKGNRLYAFCDRACLHIYQRWVESDGASFLQPADLADPPTPRPSFGCCWCWGDLTAEVQWLGAPLKDHLEDAQRHADH